MGPFYLVVASHRRRQRLSSFSCRRISMVRSPHYKFPQLLCLSMCSGFTPLRSSNSLAMSLGGDGEFHFWTDPAPRHHALSSNFGLRSPSDAVEDDCSHSPLLPHGHCYSSPAPNWRSRVIEQGRRELMEMVRDMPESSFELSLKDIVDELQGSKESPEEDGKVGEKMEREEEEEKKKSIKKRKKAKPAGLRKDQRQVLRTGSMGSGTFMIKMFFPAFLTSRKAAPKGRSGSNSKISPRPSMDGPENREECGSLSKKSTAAADPRIQKKNCSRSSSSSSRSCRECVAETPPSCWPFGKVNGKMRRQRTCNF